MSLTKKKKNIKKKTAKKKVVKKTTKKKAITKKKKTVAKKKVAKKVHKKKTTKKVQPKAPAEVKPKKVNYLNNKDLLAEVILSKKNGQMTNKLALMLQMLCARYGKRGNFSGYTYNDDMQAYAMLMLVKTWNSFNPKKSKNPFAFFTQCIKNSFIQYLNNEKRHRTLRDELLLDQGRNPSFNYQLEHEQRDGERHTLHEEVEVVPKTPVVVDSEDSDLIEY